MKSKVMSVITMLIAVTALSVSLLKSSGEKKIGYVRTQYLFDNYIGTKEARSKLENMKVGWQAELDTLKSDYKLAVENLNAELPNLSEITLAKRQNVLRSQYDNLTRYAGILDDKSNDEEKRLLDGVVAQVESYTKQYGEANSYDIILGMNSNGTVIYGIDGIDVTDQLLKELNNYYLNGNKQN